MISTPPHSPAFAVRPARPAPSDGRGPRLIAVLRRASQDPFRIQSDFARAMADIIGWAASDGCLTTRIAAGIYGRSWHITAKGRQRLRDAETAAGGR